MMVALLKRRFVDKQYIEQSWSRIAEAPVASIRGISERDGIYLKTAFGIQTIRDLAENKFVHIAQTIVSLALIEELEDRS